MDDDEQDYVILSTLYYRESILDYTRIQTKFPIYPRQISSWTYTYLSIFLNELHDFVQSAHCFEEKSDGTLIFRFNSYIDNSHFIIITIKDDVIEVEASTNWLYKWTKYSQYFYTDEGTGNRKLKKLKIIRKFRFTKVFFNINNSSKAFLNKLSLALYSTLDFSKIFNFFAKKITNYKIKRDEDTEMLFEYKNCFCIPKEQPINSFLDLKNAGMTCYMKLFIKLKISPKKQQSYIKNHTNYYIDKGVFLMPQAKSIFDNPDLKIDGFYIHNQDVSIVQIIEEAIYHFKNPDQQTI